jgi:hypothetical protein
MTSLLLELLTEIDILVVLPRNRGLSEPRGSSSKAVFEVVI